jgi:anti-sigma factor RsiW
MNCKEALELQHAHVDGELDLAHNLQMEAHLQSCAACRLAGENLQHLRVALRADELFSRAPAGLRRRIRSALSHEDRNEPRAVSWFPWLWLKLAGMSVAIALLAWLAVVELKVPSAADRLAQEITSAHVRSLMASHLMDVASTDQHTVKPWFDGKLDFAPAVVNLTDHGFPLIGGRLDYLENRPVAALIYQRQKHLINLFIWPSAADSATSETLTTYHGYNLIHWRAAGMTYWAVSDLNRSELRDFAQLIGDQTVPVTKP